MSDLGVTRKVLRRDRPWTDAWVGALCGPFDMPSRQAVHRAAATLAERYPHCRLAWGWDDARRRWTMPGSGITDDLVVDGSGMDPTDLGLALDVIGGDQSLRKPLTLIRFDDYLGLRMSHAIGDGRTFNEIFAVVLHTAMGEDSYPWRIGPTQRFPLGSAMVRTFGRNPALVRAALADRPIPVPGQAEAGVPWTPARRTLAAVIPADVKAARLAVARRDAPGASWLAVLISGLLRALAAAGVPVAPDISVVVDLRRYLSNTRLDGNFVTGVPLRIDHRHGPGEVTEMMRATVRSGRPLATQAMAMRALRSGPVHHASIDPDPRVRVTFSAMGTPPQIDALPFRPGHPAIYAGGVEPDGPRGITILVSETSRTSVVTASFHENVIEGDVVRAALAALTDVADASPSQQAIVS